MTGNGVVEQDAYRADCGRTAPAMPDPAAEIVKLAANLLRLQSRLGPIVAAGGADLQAAAGRSAREAATNSGIEVLRGIAVSLVSEIRDAAERGAFHYLYQPIVSAVDGALVSYEALMRWQRGRETVVPALFLPIAEESGAITHIQQQLLDEVAAAWRHIPAPVSVSLNWSPRQLANGSAISALIDRVKTLGIDPARIVIEITERSAMVEPDLARAGILRLKEYGFRIALDDFGTGYCSFAWLNHLPIDLLKVDCTLTREVHRSPRAAAVLEGILDVAHKLGHRVVAEGVETPQQLRALRQLGCDLLQGRVIGSPAPLPAPQGARLSWSLVDTEPDEASSSAA